MEESYKFMKILNIEEAKKFATGKKVVIVTGVTGQDGSFMVDYLLRQNDANIEIFGGARRLSVSNHINIDHLANEPRFHLINFDLTDTHSISQIIASLQPSYFINFAAQSFVKASWDFPAQTWETNTTSVLHILEAIRLHAPSCRFYNAGSSEEFGDVSYTPQDEKHPSRPRSPYGASKAAARQLVKVYRDSYHLYAIQGWLFNHEGTRRGEEFVTRKITKAIAEIKLALKQNREIKPLELGNMDAARDWSDAEDCVDAVWRMLNQEVYNHLWLPTNPVVIETCKNTKELSKHIKEYVVSSDHSYSIRRFVTEAFAEAGIEGEWIGDKENEKFINLKNRKTFLRINPAYYRPAEVDKLCGNSTAIRTDLGWSPKTDFRGLVKKMVQNDIDLLNKPCGAAMA